MCRMQKITQVSCPGKDKVEPESTPGVPSIPLRATDRKDGADLFVHKLLNRRMPNGMYGGVRGRDWRGCPSKVPPTRLRHTPGYTSAYCIFLILKLLIFAL